MISFTVTETDKISITRIVDRAASIHAKYRLKFDRTECSMDITAAHANGCPLDLQKLEHAGNMDFLHDVVGISAHIDRRTGKLVDNFLPRCAARRGAA